MSVDCLVDNVDLSAPVSSSDPCIQDAIYFSPYLWTCVDIAFSSLFATLLYVCLCMSYSARWTSMRSTLGLRRWVLFGLILAQFILHVARVLRDGIEIKHMRFIDATSAFASDLVLSQIADLSRLAVLFVLLRTAMCFVRRRLIPDRRKHYESLKVFFTAFSMVLVVIGGGTDLLLAILLPQEQSARRGDLAYGVAAPFTLSIDACFFLLNGIAMAHVAAARASLKEKKSLGLYLAAASTFQLLFGLRMALVSLTPAYGVDERVLYPHSQGFKKPMYSWHGAEAVQITGYMFDSFVWGLLMTAGLFALVLLGRQPPASVSPDTGLTDQVVGDEYSDDEPHRVAVGDQEPPPYSDRAGQREGQLVDVSVPPGAEVSADQRSREDV